MNNFDIWRSIVCLNSHLLINITAIPCTIYFWYIQAYFYLPLVKKQIMGLLYQSNKTPDLVFYVKLVMHVWVIWTKVLVLIVYQYVVPMKIVLIKTIGTILLFHCPCTIANEFFNYSLTFLQSINLSEGSCQIFKVHILFAAFRSTV